ncbi:hypothetical protein [Pyrobaculum aerophilum]|uniref:Uncharacterized protein n=1 Tax=Pyrobaculum aerophilum TaxID=13773 RepID=A0A371QTW5_9CREN|nr:hypothetical protein [Pyrobaculum aerophilum]MCX8137330.1 hypothetical protein [Pyrobaculum aerophilum]RFA92340.1 hypothetical protein CGL51_14560 [Pyrobaculum aerophilum]RFA99008.1 hypothetical protein CGL52_05830 [Pyrobaculum aerophilum]
MDNIEKILRALGLKKDEITSCDIYINYFMQYLASIERKIAELKSKVDYLEEKCFKNDKETNK